MNRPHAGAVLTCTRLSPACGRCLKLFELPLVALLMPCRPKPGKMCLPNADFLLYVSSEQAPLDCYKADIIELKTTFGS